MSNLVTVEVCSKWSNPWFIGSLLHNNQAVTKAYLDAVNYKGASVPTTPFSVEVLKILLDSVPGWKNAITHCRFRNTFGYRYYKAYCRKIKILGVYIIT